MGDKLSQQVHKLYVVDKQVSSFNEYAVVSILENFHFHLDMSTSMHTSNVVEVFMQVLGNINGG